VGNVKEITPLTCAEAGYLAFGQMAATLAIRINKIQNVSLFRLPFNERFCGRNLSTIMQFAHRF
jgi:hypothetical protein